MQQNQQNNTPQTQGVYAEKKLNPIKGKVILLVSLLVLALSITGFILSAMWLSDYYNTMQTAGVVAVIIAVVAMIVFLFLLAGFKVLQPNEALVLLFFGKYHGTIATAGFFWVNPFTTSFNPANTPTLRMGKKISLKANAYNNEQQKVHDSEGNPIEIGVVILWRIIDTARAVFNVENYSRYVSTQADAATRQVARLFPYDAPDDNEKSLRCSSQEVSELLQVDLQERVNIAGLEIVDVRISHLAYAKEIAAVMLQRQQAAAIIAARQKIVDGAVGMVEMALEKISANKIVTLSEDKKAEMVSNLLVVLCGNRDTQPTVNISSN